ncbi:M20 family metallopeptidase [Alkalibacillus aidingensis]|uniref:M20 family metallopeptidase n=1 Tax=Alkalibacillus aidingensis TaxID=2747607 RepID=UPI0016609CFF|nr:M20 family metallopeptidase [Alkalibacillus aidingensis]
MDHVKNIEDLIEQKSDLFVSMSEKIWEFAETSFQEKQSAKYIAENLVKQGFTVEEEVAGIKTAFVASFGSGKPVVAFLGEYDALAGLSQEKGVSEYQPVEKGGNGHGCGHNLLGTGSFASAVAVKDYMEEHGLSGTVRYYGCPAEESGDAKAYMVKAGLFVDVDFAICWHPAPVNSVLRMDVLATQQVYFRFKGRSAHAAASPYLGRSALDAVELMNIGVNYLREHIVPEARVHYAVTNTGGHSPNVVQSDAEVLYLIRGRTVPQAKEMYERVCKIAEGAALMTETELEIVFDSGSSDLVHNHVLDDVVQSSMTRMAPPTYTDQEREFAKAIRETLSEAERDSYWAKGLKGHSLTDFVVDREEIDEMTGSTDVADVSWVTPTTQCLTTCFANGTSLHSWQAVSQVGMSIGQKGMLYAGKVMAATAIEVMQNEELLAQAKRELEERTAEIGYISPIPEGAKPGLEK